MTSTRASKKRATVDGEPASEGSAGESTEVISLREEAFRRLPQALTVSVYAPHGVPGHGVPGHGAPGHGAPATVRLAGRRLDGHGQGDRFVHDEPVGELPPGAPFALTARVPRTDGLWRVDATVIEDTGGASGSNRRARRRQARAAVALCAPVWSWRHWRLSPAAPTPVAAGPIPLARLPGVVRGAWTVAVTVALLVALGLQWWLLGTARLWPGWSVVSLGAVGVGVLGARGWYRFLHRDRPEDGGGWAVQGFVAGLVAALGLALGLGALAGLARPGAVLDATAPALLVGLGLGRIGCFFTGCCSGCPTTGRWGLLASDRRLLTRRVPVQLYEAALGAALGASALAVLLLAPRALAAGALFTAALALHVGLRQLLLPWRAEPRRTRRGRDILLCAGLAIAAAALTTGMVAALP